MMIKDHTDALMKLRSGPGHSSADVKPNAKHQATADRLAKLSGAEFDREYMNAMVMDHEEAVSFLEKQSGKETGSSTSPSAAGTQDLGKTAQELLPTVRHHLEMAQQIQEELQSGPATTDKKSSRK
jgi:putative membrane protein